MLTQNYFKLGGLYHLTIDDLYEEDCLSDLKEELEAIHGVKLKRAITDYELVYVCKNGLVNISQYGNQISNPVRDECRCEYYVRFSIEFRLYRDLYKLRSFNLNHAAFCYDHQQAIFYRNKRALNYQAGAITKIIAYRRARGQECGSPKFILSLLCKEENLSQDFIYEDVIEDYYRRKLKKRLDNIIAEAKRVPIVVRWYYTLNQTKDFYVYTVPQLKTPQYRYQSRTYMTRNNSSSRDQDMKKQQTKRVVNQSLPARQRRGCNQQTEAEKYDPAQMASILSTNSEVDPGLISPELLIFPEEFARPNKTKSEPDQCMDQQNTSKNQGLAANRQKNKKVSTKSDGENQMIDQGQEKRKKKSTRKQYEDYQ